MPNIRLWSESCGSVGGRVVVARRVRKPQEDLQSTNLQSTNQEDLQSTNLGPWGSQRMNHQLKNIHGLELIWVLGVHRDGTMSQHHVGA